MVTVATESGSILKPYILRATYQWCLDFGSALAFKRLFVRTQEYLEIMWKAE